MYATYSRRFAKRVAYRTELITPAGTVLQLGKQGSGTYTPADLPALREQFAFDGFEVRMTRITFPLGTDDIHTEIVEL